MGNLNNLYISASFQSLLHLGNDSIISSSLVGIQDGFGNSVGIAVNSAGDLSLSGSLTASLQQGYVWVGNSVNKTVLVPTSSFAGGGSATWPVSGTPSGIVSGSSQLTSSYDSRYALSGSTNLTSLNAFTQSQESKNSTLATYTGSVNTQLTNLSTSQSIDNQKWINISTQSGSWGGGGTINTGSFATTGSNRFVGNQTITGSVNISGGERLYIKREVGGAQQELRLGSTDNLNNFAFIVTGSDQNPGQQVWGINVGGGVWANSFDAGVAFNSYVSASNGLQIGRGSDDGAGRNALRISKATGTVGLLINETDTTSSFFIGTRDNGNGNLIVSSSANERYIEFGKDNGWIEVNSTINLNNNASARSRLDVRNTFVSQNYQIYYPTGSNQQAGTAVLNGGNPGTVTVSNSLVTANSIIMLTKQTLTNAHSVAVSSKGAGTFTILSTGNGDADTVGWFIINNS